MDRRKVVLSAVVVTTAGALAVFAAPVLSGARIPPGSEDSVAGSPVAAEVLLAMQRDLTLSPDQVTARLKKEAWAARTDRTLRRELGATYAGAWMTPTADQLVVGVTTEAGADKVRATGAEPRLLSRGEATLNEVKLRLDRGAKKIAKTVSGYFVDVTANTVVVLTRPGDQAAARTALASTGVPADAVKLVASDETPKPLFDVQGGDPYFINADFECSIGFAVQGGFITAGHCGRVGNTTDGFNDAPQGRFKVSSFPDNDYAFVETNNRWTPVGVVNTNRGKVTIAGSQEAPVGASVCRTGATSGTRCGVIQAKNTTVNYPEGTVTGLTRTSACAEGGDSGGPYLAGNQAQGIVSGGSGDCTGSGSVTFFQPINEILTANRLTLITAGGGNPSPTASRTPATVAPTTPSGPPAATAPGSQPSANPPGNPPAATTPPATTTPPAATAVPTTPPARTAPPANTTPPARTTPPPNTAGPARTTPPPTTAPPTTAPPTTQPSATRSPVRTAPPATNPPGSAGPADPPVFTCDGHQAIRHGAVQREGDRQIQPKGGYFKAAYGTHTACLDGPDGTDLDVELQRWTGRRWKTVAAATGQAADEQLTFTGPAGFYRYRVHADGGSGSYVVGIDAPY